MKYSLRNQMLVAILGPPILAGAYLLLRSVTTETPPSGVGWLDLLIIRDLLLAAMIVALTVGWWVERQMRIREERDAQLLILELEIELAKLKAHLSMELAIENTDGRELLSSPAPFPAPAPNSPKP